MDQVKMGKLIAKVRKEKNMTQDELGELLGVNGKAVSKWECGINPPDISILTKLSEILEVEVGDLLKGKYPADKIEEEKLRKIEEAKKEKNRHRKIKVTFIILLLIVIFFNFFLVLITRKIVTNKFKEISFSSADARYVVSGNILSTDVGKKIILTEILRQGYGTGTNEEPIVKSVHIIVNNKNKIIFNYNFDEVKDDYNNVKYYYLSEILKNMPVKIYELAEDDFNKNDELSLEIIYITKNDEVINEKINLEMKF